MTAAEPRAAEPWVASTALAADLQAVLVDLIELAAQAKQAHWNVVGRNFRDLHLQLDEVVDLAREASDTIAERLRALRATADGRTNTVVAQTTLAPFPAGEQNTSHVVDLLVDRLHTVAGTVHRVHDAVDAQDPTSADLLHGITEGLQKQAWLIGAENTTTEGA